MGDLAKRVQHSLDWRARAIIDRGRDIIRGLNAARINRRMASVQVDPRITYPCYKSLDMYLDVERLKALDGVLKEKISDHLKKHQDAEPFETGELKSTLFGRAKPGSKLIFLTKPKAKKASYFHIHQPHRWQLSEDTREYPELMAFIQTLPFKETARMIIMCDDQGRAVTRHRDHAYTELNHEFVWFRTNLDKAFYVQDHTTTKRLYLTSYTAWFDTVNQFHGADGGNRALTFSLRVDGIFSDEFRRLIPTPPYNPASTSALWASLSGEAGVNG